MLQSMGLQNGTQLSDWTEMIFLHWTPVYSCQKSIEQRCMNHFLDSILLHWFVYYDIITSLFLFLQFYKNKVSIYSLPLFLLKIYFSYSKPFYFYLYFRISLPISHNNNKNPDESFNGDGILSIRKIDI